MLPKPIAGRSKGEFTLRLQKFAFSITRTYFIFISLGLLALLVGGLVAGSIPVHAEQTPVNPTQPENQGQAAPTAQIARTTLTSLRFRHLDTSTGLPDNHVETILQDRAGFLWIGTLGGLVRYDGYHYLVFKHDPSDPASLSNDNIGSLLETQDGLIWITTRGGNLNRFDPVSQRFSQFKINAMALVQDRQGTLWASTMEGLFGRLDPQTGVLQPQPLANCANSDPQSLIRKMVIDPESGALWMVGSNLYRFDPASGQSNCFTPPPASPPPAQGQLQNPATGSDQLINSVPVTENGPGSGRMAMRFTDVATGEAGFLWLAGNTGISRFDKASGNFTLFHLDKDLSPIAPDSGRPKALNIVSLYLDKEGVLWLGADGADGIYKFDPKTQKLTAHYSTDPANPDSFAGGGTWAIMEDREGLLWFGTIMNGVNMLDRRQTQFTYYRRDPLSDNSLPKTPIQALYQEPGGKIWIGSNSELTSFNPQDNTFQHFLVYSKPLPPIRPETLAISAFYPDDQNGLWFDGIDGLYRFDRKTQQTQVYRAPEMTQGPGAGVEIDSIVQDELKNFWVLSKNVLYYFDTASLKFTRNIPVKAPDAAGVLKTVIARIVNIDKQGEVWVGGVGFLGQLDRQTGQFKGYFNDPARSDSIANFAPNEIYADSYGDLWLPSAGGLIRFNRQAGSFKLYTEREGLPGNSLFGLLEDEQGNFWISSTKGLSKFNPATGVFRNYDTSDGLQGNQFNGYSYFKNAQGELLFGGENGLTRFLPSQIVENSYKPPVVLTGMELFNHTVVPGQDSFLKQPIWNTTGISLEYNQNFVSFEFAALSYAAPRNNHYRYRLEGLEKDWKEVDSSTRSVNYANLQAGEYTFRVQGTNSAGIWSDQSASLKIFISRPWWDSTWFRLPVFVAILELLVVGFRWWSHRVERRNRQLEALIEERTKELAIAKEQADIAREQADIAKEQVEVANLELQRLSVLDELTQIANRRRFDQYLFAQWQYSNRQPVSMLLCDVDFFKHYNDNYGHQAGDHVLYMVAQAINRVVGYTKDLVARFGGEEFAVILPETGTSGALQVARMIQLEIQKLNIQHGFSEVCELITISIGVATITPTSDNSFLTKEEPRLLIAAADAALYQAKGQGRNRVSVSPAMAEQVVLN